MQTGLDKFFENGSTQVELIYLNYLEFCLFAAVENFGTTE